MNELMNVKLGKNNTITSMELVTIINEFRKAECEDYTELKHDNFMKKIRKEVETLKFLGIKGDVNIYASSYINSQNKEQPCYVLNRDGMLQMLNSESTFVRYKTIEYINKLENEVVQAPKKLSTMEQLKLQYTVLEEHEDKINRIIVDIDDIKDNTTINYGQQEYINRLSKEIIVNALGGKGTPAYKELNRKIFCSFWKDYKRVMQVASYRDTLVKDYEKSIEFIKNWQPDKETKFMIIGCNSQIKFEEDM